MEEPAVRYLRVKAYALEPVWEDCHPKGGLLTVDGEDYGRTSFKAECMKGIAGLCMHMRCCV